jgi:subtilase family serine protease
MKPARWLAAVAAAVLPTLAPAAHGANAHAGYHAVCPAAPLAAARCHAQVVTDSKGNPAATTSPTGYGPAEFHGAYNLPTTSSGGLQTIGIVDAYRDPTIRNDLTVYSNTLGIPDLPTCASPSDKSACFVQVNQNGGSNLPRADSGWALEIALDVETAHEICQNCKIVLVETKNNFLSSLAAGVNTAANLGANAISNSYSGGESATDNSAYDHPGIAITASTGDNGYGVGYPATSPHVVAVGGTTLNLGAGNTYGSESVWNGAGSGCSAYFTQQPWQAGLTACGTKRGIADVSADADPATGASVYDTPSYQGQTGWFKVGGTSLSAPLVAAVYALAGNASSASYPASIPYANTSSLHDVTTGSNGSCGTIMCNGAAGYDGPTGVGTPNGLGGF